MYDISESTDGQSITFSANVVEAEVWMASAYKSHTVVFEMPRELEPALAFKVEANEAGFTVGPL